MTAAFAENKKCKKLNAKSKSKTNIPKRNQIEAQFKAAHNSKPHSNSKPHRLKPALPRRGRGVQNHPQFKTAHQCKTTQAEACATKATAWKPHTIQNRTG